MRAKNRQQAFGLLLFGLVTLLTTGFVAAQAPGTAAITGQISDKSGATIANAKVTALNEATGLSRTVTTTPEGVFRASLLPPGSYSLVVTAAGFQTRTLHSIYVTVTETAVVDVRMEVASAEPTKIEVLASPELAQTESSALGRVTDGNMVATLPLANRNFTQILALNPGVVVELPNAGALSKGGQPGSNQNVSANGAKTTSNNFQFNGVDANNLSENSASGYQAEIGLATPAPDTIQEFKVQTGMFDANYGRSAGANIDLESKSGANSLHGSLWEFFRNNALNANDYFFKRNQLQQGLPNKPQVLRQNQFGGTFGGPIVVNRTFFFTSYQGTIMQNGVTSGAQATAFLPPLTADRSRTALRA
jgi:hypothetical protein